MDSRIEQFYERYMREKKAAVPAHGLVYFGHLYAEYVSIKSTINNQESINLLEEINERQMNGDTPLTWNDVYVFDLEFSKYLPLEGLLRKAYELRGKYRSVVGHREYDSYLATKPPDLAAIRISPIAVAGETSATPSANAARLDAPGEAALREDVKYLMSRVYLEYALTPLREGVRAELTRKGVRWTLGFISCLAAFIIISLASASFPELSLLYALTRASTIGVVVVAGIVGGLVSMLQRIQAAPSDGDALHSLASLTNGWRGIFLAPLSGAIFSSLLFTLFAGGVLKGIVFPEIRSSIKPAVSEPATTQWVPVPSPTVPSKSDTSQVTSHESATRSSAVNVPTPTATPAGTIVSESASGAFPEQQSPPAKVSEGTSASATPPAAPRVLSSSGVNSVQFSSFLRDTGPASGTDFALLIIWSFIAGFAERLVPDTLNRLVSKAATPNS
jgi:hypothetical protein